jgi:hypothetical protein
MTLSLPGLTNLESRGGLSLQTIPKDQEAEGSAK